MSHIQAPDTDGSPVNTDPLNRNSKAADHVQAVLTKERVVGEGTDSEDKCDASNCLDKQKNDQKSMKGQHRCDEIRKWRALGR